MCSLSGFQIAAQAEKDVIQQSNCSLTQDAVLESAWVKAVAACLTSNVGLLPGRGDRGATYEVRYIDVSAWSAKGLATARVAAAAFLHNGTSCQNVLAADIKASPWWHGNDPKSRAASRAASFLP
ncbi:hypothetical protein [Variovorax sp. ZT4R33]|uniref:hypothetical protein n=1 Tax=Variovorax sp. ZT4R33 TaxID=3443743 RepID=UPI003F4575E9